MTDTIDAATRRPTPGGLPALLPLAGDPLDARLPLSLLEAVRRIDTPEFDHDAEFVTELRNKRLGLSDTVHQQIRRYADAVRRQQRVPFDEVLALARLIGRRPDASEAFREAGGRWAAAALETIGGLSRMGATTLPAIIARPVALRQLRRLATRFAEGRLVRQGSSLLLEVTTPVTVDAAHPGVGCLLYEAAFRTWLRELADSEGVIDHVLCRARGDDRCQWRTDWRRR